MTLQWVDTDHPDFISLTQKLDQTLRQRQGEAQAAFDPYNGRGALRDVAVFYDGDLAVACAALKDSGQGAAELKRVYVSPEYRRQGLARRLVEEMEQRALRLGYQRLLLETNPAFTDAVALYKRCGFTPVPPFGPYEGMQTLCLGKDLPA